MLLLITILITSNDRSCCQICLSGFFSNFLSSLPVRLSPGADILKPLSIVRFPSVPCSHLVVVHISIFYTIYPLHTTVLLRLSFARITHSTCFQTLLTLLLPDRLPDLKSKWVGETCFPPRPARGSPQTEPRVRSPDPHTTQCHR